MVQQTKQLLKEDHEAANKALFDAEKILSTISKLKEWYRKNELTFNFAELKKIAYLKKEEYYPFFWTKFDFKDFPAPYRKSIEKEISKSVNEVCFLLEDTQLKGVFESYKIESKDIDLNKIQFTKNFKEKLLKQNTYYIESDDEREIWDKLHELAQKGEEVKKLIQEKFKTGGSLFETLPGGDIRFFNERLDKFDIKPNPAAILTLRRIKEGEKNRQEHLKMVSGNQ